MGMDVYGKKPTSEVGEYFRRNIWGWHPLWEYVCEVGAVAAKTADAGHANDGHGLNAAASRLLAQVLRNELASGRTAAHVAMRNRCLDALPDEQCTICGGTGKRLPPPNVGPGKERCNGCDPSGGPNALPSPGRRPGWVRPSVTHYGLDEDDVREFADFLDACGGFKIL